MRWSGGVAPVSSPSAGDVGELAADGELGDERVDHARTRAARSARRAWPSRRRGARAEGRLDARAASASGVCDIAHGQRTGAAGDDFGRMLA
jgi:sRNA-binding protein